MIEVPSGQPPDGSRRFSGPGRRNGPAAAIRP